MGAPIVGGMSTLERLRAGAWERGGSTAGGERDRPSPPIGSLRKKKPGCDPRHYLAPPSRHNNDTPQLSAVRWGCWFGQQRARRRCLTAPPRFALFFFVPWPRIPAAPYPRPPGHARGRCRLWSCDRAPRLDGVGGGVNSTVGRVLFLLRGGAYCTLCPRPPPPGLHTHTHNPLNLSTIKQSWPPKWRACRPRCGRRFRRCSPTASRPCLAKATARRCRCMGEEGGWRSVFVLFSSRFSLV